MQSPVQSPVQGMLSQKRNHRRISGTSSVLGRRCRIILRNSFLWPKNALKVRCQAGKDRKGRLLCCEFGDFQRLLHIFADFWPGMKMKCICLSLPVFTSCLLPGAIFEGLTIAVVVRKKLFLAGCNNMSRTHCTLTGYPKRSTDSGIASRHFWYL